MIGGEWVFSRLINCWRYLQNRHLLWHAGTEQRQQYEQLCAEGWDQSACHAYLLTVTNALTSPTRLFQSIHVVGSLAYTNMLKATRQTPAAKLNMMLNRHLQAQIDEYGFLQLTSSNYQLASLLSPKSPFFPYIRDLVVAAYPTPMGLKIDVLGREIHLFRCFLDRMVINFIRHYRSNELPANVTDYDRLLQYCRDNTIALDYQTGANFHNRYHGAFDYPHNMKVQLMRDSQANQLNDARMIEFIVDIDSGNFVSEWNVYHEQADGSVDADPTHYSWDELREVADTESFNYGIPYGVYHVPARCRGTHRHLDVDQPRDSEIRRQAKQYWVYPHDYDRGGKFAEIVAAGGDADVTAWRGVLLADRPMVYADFVDYLQNHPGINPGIRAFLLKQVR